MCGPILGYQIQGGGPVLTGINYAEPNNTYVFYDEHTGYNFLPTNSPKGVAVYAALGGTLHFMPKNPTNNPYNTIYIDHGDGWQTFYLQIHSTYIRGHRMGLGSAPVIRSATSVTHVTGVR